MRKIDIHAHYGSWPFVGHNATIEDMVKTMAKYDIDSFIVSSSSAIMYDYAEGNSELFEKIDKVTGLLGYIVVNSNYIDGSIKEIKKYSSHEKWAGVKYHPEYCRRPANCDEMVPVYELLEELNVPVLIHTYGDGISSPLRLIDINKRFPKLKLIAAHMGGPRFDLGIELVLKTNENVFLEICSTDISADKIKQVVDQCGVERVLYGSDYSLFDPSYTIGAVESSELSTAQKEMIYYKNAQKVFSHLDFKKLLNKER